MLLKFALFVFEHELMLLLKLKVLLKLLCNLQFLLYLLILQPISTKNRYLQTAVNDHLHLLLMTSYLSLDYLTCFLSLFLIHPLVIEVLLFLIKGFQFSLSVSLLLIVLLKLLFLSLLFRLFNDSVTFIYLLIFDFGMTRPPR